MKIKIKIIVLLVPVIISSCGKDSDFIEYLQTQIYKTTDYNKYKFEDTNNDNHTWETLTDYYTNTDCIVYEGNYRAANDWAFTPFEKIYLEANNTYNLSFSARCSNSSNPEKLEIKYGNKQSSSAMTMRILNTFTVNSENWVKYSKIFYVTKSSYYYIGFHVESSSHYSSLYITNVEVTLVD